MSKLKFVLALCLGLTMTIQLSAQSVMQSGHIEMKMTELSSDDMDDDNMAMVQQTMGTMSMNIYFEPGRMLHDVEVMGGFMKSKNLTETNGTITMYSDMMGQKTKVVVNAEMQNDPNVPNINSFDFGNIEGGTEFIETSETMNIAGLETKKVNVNDEDGNLMVSLWVSDLIKFDNPQSNGNELMNTIPLGIEVEQEGMTIKLMAQSVNDLPNGAFDINDEEYQLMTLDEFLQSMSGGIGN